MSPRNIVDSLVNDLAPVRRAGTLSHVMFIWCGLSWFLVGAAIFTIGPLREGIIDEILASPRLALELAIGTMAGIAAIVAGLELGVPGSPAPPRLWSAPLLLFAGWVVVILFELINPIVDPSASAMRAHCFLQTMLVSLPSATAALYLLHGRILFEPGRAGLLAGAAAAAIPALWMELSCMTEPLHALQFHLSPILLIGGVTALLAHWLVARP